LQAERRQFEVPGVAKPPPIGAPETKY